MKKFEEKFLNVLVKRYGFYIKDYFSLEVATKKCPYCLSEIDINAVKCPHCTSDIPAEKE